MSYNKIAPLSHRAKSPLSSTAVQPNVFQYKGGGGGTVNNSWNLHNVNQDSDSGILPFHLDICLGTSGLYGPPLPPVNRVKEEKVPLKNRHKQFGTGYSTQTRRRQPSYTKGSVSGSLVTYHPFGPTHTD
jgi:hypothetical protein